MFDNEGEKEQWEDEQKVSGIIVPHFGLIKAICYFSGGIFSSHLLFIKFHCFAASWQRLVHDGWRIWWVPQPLHLHIWRICEEKRTNPSEADTEKNICPQATDQWGTVLHINLFRTVCMHAQAYTKLSVYLFIYIYIYIYIFWCLCLC